MSRKLIAIFLLSFSAVGCHAASGPDSESIEVGEEGSALGTKPGDFCGGFAGVACASGLYCSYDIEASCGAGDASGTCQLVPGACTMQHDPVCGCDGVTYGNACLAAMSSVSVAHEGECSKGGGAGEGETCGGFAGIACADGLFCDFAPETSCGSGDQTGLCEAPPGACLQIYNPVCGCDGVTYGNACTAAQNQVSVLHTGACK